MDKYEFNVFNLRETTDGLELETLLPFVLAKHGLIANNKVDGQKMINFVRVLARGYKYITYHN